MLRVDRRQSQLHRNTDRDMVAAAPLTLDRGPTTGCGARVEPFAVDDHGCSPTPRWYAEAQYERGRVMHVQLEVDGLGLGVIGLLAYQHGILALTPGHLRGHE